MKFQLPAAAHYTQPTLRSETRHANLPLPRRPRKHRSMNPTPRCSYAQPPAHKATTRQPTPDTPRRSSAWLRRARSLTLPLIVLALWCCGCRPEASPSEQTTASQRPLEGEAAGFNVVLLSIDTLRADRLGSYGYSRYETSPAIDQLLNRGVRFDQAQAPRSITWPSLASTLTGLFPSGHGLIYNGYSLRDDQPTLPKILQENGYETAAFLSNMCKANHQGWDSFFCAGGVDQRVNRQATDWLETRESERPFLLWAHYFGPHPPYYNGGARAQEWDPGYDGVLTPKKGVLDRVVTDGPPLDDRDLEHLEAIYSAAVRGTDDLVSHLLEALEASGELERTLIVFLADHGEDLYEHNKYLYHACSVYQSSLHVPLGFVAPGLFPDGEVLQPVELVDVLPTVLDLLGVGSPGCLHGTSLVPYLERPDRTGAGKPAFTEYGDTRIATVLHDGWKLVSNPDGMTPECMPKAPLDLYPIADVELYDLTSDPAERNNLADAHPDRVEKLRTLLKAHQADMCSPGGDPGSQEIPEDLKKELKALGYVAG